MSKNYTIKIEFFTYWHCGSGLSAGADVDALVIKDNNDFPFVPGKTIKGLIRDAVTDLLEFKYKDFNVGLLRKTFGNSEDKHFGNDITMCQGEAFFSNVELPETYQRAIKDNHAQQFLFQSISQTAIDDNGIAQNHSLRKIQVTVPCTLEGSINDVPEGMTELLNDACSYIKRLGVGRNRGLGRCEIKIEEAK